MGGDTANQQRLIKGSLCGHPWRREISDWLLPTEGLVEKTLLSTCPLYYLTKAYFSFRPQLRVLRSRAAFFKLLVMIH